MADNGDPPMAEGEEGASEVTVQALEDMTPLVDFLCGMCPFALGGDPHAFRTAVESAETNAMLTAFAQDAGVPVLMVMKTVEEAAADEDGTVAAGVSSIVYSFEVEITPYEDNTTVIVFIKRGEVLEAGRSIFSQLLFLNLGHEKPFETLQQYLRGTFAPLFESLSAGVDRASGSGSGAGGSEDDAKMGISKVKKKLAELELSLRHLQQEVDIPEVKLPIDPEIREVLARCKATGKRMEVEDLGELVGDATYLNALQAGVNRWIAEIQKVTKLKRDPSQGTVVQEISFWMSLDRALHQIVEQLKAKGIEMTLQVLKHAKRFHATVSFESDTHLKPALDTVNNYMLLMKEFPINELLSATELERISEALKDIFNHVKKLRNTRYPIERALKLVEAISRDLMDQLLSVLGGKRLLALPFEEFNRHATACLEVFSVWEELVTGFKEMAREIARQRRDPKEEKLPIRVHAAHAVLQDRIDQLHRFRRQHEELRAVIHKILPRVSNHGGSDFSALEEINMAFEDVRNVDALDVSPDGEETWDIAMENYEARIDKVENQIIAKLRDRLAKAKNANEMFRVFQQFNALFFRPRIRGAIQEYQAQLIARVKEDIKDLQEKFKVPYSHSEASRMSRIRDLPPLAGAIIWARQIEMQLATYMSRVETVLGRGWEQHVEGQRLKQDSDSFKRKLNTQMIFDNWVKETESRNYEVIGRIFYILKKQGVLSLHVNFDEQVITLFKEVRNLQALGFRVPFNVQLVSSRAQQVYPFAVSLMETIRTYKRTCEKVNPSIEPLLAAYKAEVQTLIGQGFQLHWESHKLDAYVNSIAELIFHFEEKVDDLLVKCEQIDAAVEALSGCALKEDVLGETLAKIQAIVDELNLETFSNLDGWVENLDARVEEALTTRLAEAVTVWVDEFHNENPDDVDLGGDGKNTRKGVSMRSTRGRGGRRNGGGDDGANGGDKGHPTVSRSDMVVGGRPAMQTIVHEIAIRNQLMYLNPPLEAARADWIEQLNTWLGLICALPRIQSNRFDVLNAGLPKIQTYASLLTRLPEGFLQGAYSAIEEQLAEVKSYVGVWLQYQALWDMDTNSVFATLGEDLGKWSQLLIEIRKARSTFDNSETQKHFGPIIVDYEQVQAKVNNKYDAWHKLVLSNFGTELGGRMVNFHETISDARVELEKHAIETVSTQEAVAFIIKVQEMKRNLKGWTDDVETYRSGQRLLERQRFQFPRDWLYFDNVEGEWSAFNEILSRKDRSIQNQIPMLQQKIVAEDRIIDEKLQAITTEWHQNKPVSGSLNPSEAMNVISIYDGRISRLNEEYQQIRLAKEALDLEADDTDALADLREELGDLKGVWSELSTVCTQIEDLKATPWTAVLGKKLRASLHNLIDQLKAMPNRMRQYEAWDHVQNTINDYLKANAIVMDLKSDGIKERHWKLLKQNLGTSWRIADLTLGDIWEVDLLANEQAIREVITVAQGEMALEEFLRQVKEFWQAFELELVQYQRKCMLIKGWDDLFNKVLEHLSSLSAMKASPYYKPFAEEADTWDEKLNRVRNIFDLWIDVQRRWVYLSGIFSGSADIQVLLPQESSRFKTIDQEFVALMRKVAKDPMILQVIAIKGLEKSLERTADLLTKIQKALGEYLERQRSAFPRFYFVGDEDLLEIIGNSKDINKIQKHLKKMFAGLSSLMLEEDDDGVVLGMASATGEEVPFHEPVNLAEHPKIHEMLSAIEEQMKISLAFLLSDAVIEMREFFNEDALDSDHLFEWIDHYPDQLLTLAAQAIWTENTERALPASNVDGAFTPGPLNAMLARIVETLEIFADAVLGDLPAIKRKKYEHLMMELIHQRDTVREQIANEVRSLDSFDWLYQMRFYFNENTEDPQERLVIRMANTEFFYGFEYLGVKDKLVHTPLTNRCYTTLTQALNSKMGGSPFGPAGTGKTESVKMLGAQLGRFVLVFCCDENFDFQAMGRIFVGLCQVGAWGCFDEFNRLTERILSAVSQQIQTMQLALSAGRKEVELLGKNVKLNPNIGVFITMNPGYAGRSNLPDNLKQLFRSIAMTAPDKELIAQVMLFSQGFKSAERLSNKVVPLFRLCKEQLSSQSHYDFGLRSLKSVLVSAGNIKRKRRTQPVAGEEDLSLQDSEQSVLIQSVCETLIPKLVSQDIPLLRSLMGDVFPGVQLPDMEMAALKAEIEALCTERNLVFGDLWVSKCLQLNQITHLNHGLMLVGPSGSGKSTAWNVLLKALENLDGVEGVAYVLDPKAISVRELYGSMDPTTREWSDGLFTGILRAIIDNVRGEAQKRHWIIFDGDVDPEWVENMNSLLDDNKLLTLPNGERLALPDNVRIMFEVSDLLHATPATVSRCGMVWFSEETVTLDMIFQRYLMEVRNVPIKALLEEEEEFQHAHIDLDSPPPRMLLQRKIASQLEQYFAPGGLVDLALERSSTLDHVMDWTRLRVLGSVFSLINKGIGNIHEYNLNHPDFMLDDGVVTKYMSKVLIFSLTWAFSGSCKIYIREEFSEWLKGVTDIEMPAGPVIDFEVDIESGEWAPWVNKVPHVDVDPESMGTAIIPTLDTVRHVEVLYAWLADHKPLLLCGPPGSGKTMTLFSTLRKATEYDVCAINFSSSTSPELVLTTLEQKCEVRRTADGLVMQPAAFGKWLVVFCDEINLPEPDKYETQVVITFIRQLIEQGGYYRPKDLQWVSLHRIQFVGACNPPTDPGRTPLSHRFLRHAPLILCDYPAYASLTQIYGTFNRSLLKKFPEVSNLADALTECMVSFYTASQKKFTPEIQQHYIYSPRELTRWVRGIYDAIKPLASVTETELVRLWAHEGLRLFGDRLVTDEERAWTNEHIDQVARDNFPDLDDEALRRPILFSNWLSDNYESVEREDLREYVHEKLKTFYEEELDVPLVLFNEVLDNVLIIDRVFQQKQGHVLLIGQSGAGKTVLSRFVAWMNGLSVFQIRASQKYSGEDFDNDLRTILRRSGAEKEKICFIFDESNIKDTGFLERMNTLLANGEIPGLFEDDDYSQLMNQCKVESQHEGKMLDSEEELYEWFTNQIMRNLHVVFTMNPAGGGFENRTSTSPALFNRCVLNWFGDWPASALFQVALEFTANIDLELETYEVPQFFPAAFPECPQPPTYRVAVMNAMVSIHNLVDEANKKLAKRQGRLNYVTPRHYLDLINHYLRIYDETRNELEEQQNHLNGGLQKLIETEADVQELQGTLASRKIELEAKSAEADLKLKQMVKDQQAAEEKKKEGEVIAAELGEKMIEIEAARVKAYADLEAVEPMVQEAAEAVNGIKKKQLDEIRAFANPPKLVKLALESVCVMLGLDKTDWTSIRKFSKKDGFISSIVNYDPEALDPRTRSLMQRKYLANPDYTFEKINNASRACGPLCKWASAVVQYAEVLETVEPLRAELQRLEDDAAVSQARSDEVNAMVAELEESLERYTKEYADLIAETTRISTEMETTRVKVDRSSALLASLSEERVRWESESQNFQSQMATVVGDVLICSAFMAYSGFFDQQYRSMLLRQWQKVLTESNIAFKEDLSIVNFLSIPDDRLQWQENALPDDDLCSENAIMISRFNRYPLLIDPSGQATEFVMNQYADKKIKKTSFLDKGFLKALESSLRFGTPILVQDVENVDPIVNPILNRELRRAGGRVLMSLGDQDIDFSPAFMMIMTTRDPTFNFAPDLCSRVTFVNFTVTPSSLQNQCLSRVLKQERPDIDKKRSDLIKLQGEFRVKLRQLEDRLLKTLSESEGNILDNDTVIATLETLKQETSEIQAKVAETEEVMVEIQTVSAQYEPMAASCSRIYFALEQLANIGFLYQFSLNFFLSIFEEVLMHNSNLEGVEDPMERLSILVRDLFAVVFERVARALKHEDQLPIAIIFAQIRLEADHDDIPPVDFDFFLKGTTHAPETPALPACFNALAGKRIAALTTLTSFRELANHMGNNEAAWEEVARAHKPELRIPPCWETGGTEQSEAIVRWKELLVVKAIRPDRILAASTRLINTVFGPEFLDIPPLDMAQIVDVEQSADTPILLVSQPGFDASGYVDELATAERKQCKSVSIGSPEGFELAEKAIAQASKAGTWVMLKNVHLAPQWLVELEKKLHGLSTVPNFRLFLTSELNPSVPVNLLRMSRILMFEPPPGVKANLLRSFSKIPASRMDAEPTERARLYFAVTWLHAIVQERMQYRPLGWAQAYEFNDADQRCGLDAIDYWIASVAGDRSNVAPEKIPWDALRTLTGQSIYGGKIDNVFDQALLESFLSQLFAASLYDADYQLVHADGDSAAIVAPEARKKAEFLSWIQSLPDTQTPAWLGLPSNAELVLLSNQGNQMVVKVLNMQSMADDDDDSASQESSALSTDTRPAWMRSLHTQVRAWAGMLPEEINLLAVDEDKIRNPLFRCIEREIRVGAALLSDIHRDLGHLDLVCQGEMKQTNHIRMLLATLSKGVIPKTWREEYSVPPTLAVSVFLTDFISRCHQLQSLSASSDYGKSGLKLGELFVPNAFLTASQQYAAQARGWPLEELVLSVQIGETDLDDQSFLMQGLQLQGGDFEGGNLVLSQEMMTHLPDLRFRWINVSEMGDRAGQVKLPVYLNEARTSLQFEVYVPAGSLDDETVYERGLAILLTDYTNMAA